jgi:putative ABC transport system substrate-binding protein
MINGRRRSLVLAVVAGAASTTTLAAAPSGKVLTVGFLYSATQPDLQVFRDFFVPAMKQRGYFEGQNLKLEWRFADNKAELLDGLAVDLVQRKVDIIVAGGTPPTLSAAKATKKIPIISVGGNNPVNLGLARSIANPGTNVTGITLMEGTVAKGVELLRTLVPKARKIGWLMNPDNPSSQRSPEQLDKEGKTYGLELIGIPYRTASDLDRELGGANKGRVDAVYVRLDSKLNADSNQIAAYTVEHGIPAVGSHRRFVPAGGLASFGQSYDEQYGLVVEYIDLLANGANVAALPIVLPTRFELVLNRKTAARLGLTIPSSLLLRADRVVD